ncbi:MAG: glycoside hydrolase domain-containing protein [Streptosporangiaceae bacterium]
MTSIVEPAADGLIFDTDQRCSLAQLRALKAAGFLGGVRTVTFSEAADPSDITASEVQDFMSADLGLMLYQRVRNPGWRPSGPLGGADGRTAIAKAMAAGYMPKASLFDDLEGIGASSSETLDYANTKALALLATYLPGEYIGFDVPLTGGELFHELIASCYWRSTSRVPDIPERGYALVQISENVLVAGMNVDVSISCADKLGGRASWMHNAT